MRLLECGPDGEFSLTEDLIGDTIPLYAILSHRWGPQTEEVTYRDVVDSNGRGKAGYKKLTFCAEQARRDGLLYFWVDTCCIDKSTSDEVQASINSMFRWYRNAARCYVYLSDISIDGDQSQTSWEAAFRASEWFTRGWTLQELVAPASVEFFTKEGRRLGDKTSLKQQIHEITGIALPALQGTPLSQFDIEERFEWAETRQTTREEDWAYCLLGIFGVFMPLIYGEGKENAIRRLRLYISGNQIGIVYHPYPIFWRDWRRIPTEFQ
jgi:Heterokaryon incompatibility protein (HET)